MLSELTTPNAKSQQALMHECIPCRAAPAAVPAQEPNLCIPERPCKPGWVPAAALPPPDTHPCPLLVLLMLLGAHTKQRASGNPGKASRYLGVLPARLILRSLLLGTEGTEPLCSKLQRGDGVKSFWPANGGEAAAVGAGPGAAAAPGAGEGCSGLSHLARFCGPADTGGLRAAAAPLGRGDRHGGKEGRTEG